MSGAMHQINPPNSQGKTPVLRGLQDPVAVERERRNAGQTAAARAAVRPGRPADDADNGGAPPPGLKHPAPRTPRAGAEPPSTPPPHPADPANLQNPRPAGRGPARPPN